MRVCIAVLGGFLSLSASAKAEEGADALPHRHREDQLNRALRGEL